MKLFIHAAIASLFLVSTPALAEDPPKEMTEAQKKAAAMEVQMKVYNMLMGSAGALDACTTAYTTEFPNNSGKATVQVKIIKDGSVMTANVETQLEGARNLRSCLESVARKWRFPPLQKESDQVSLTVQVKKGQKFTLRKPGEQAQQQQQQQQQPSGDEGFMQFLPESFLPGYGGQ
jgi:hypothetical protein